MAAQSGDVIVVAVDDSKFSKNAMDWYINHMHKPANKVILVTCMELPSMPSRDTWEKQSKAGRDKGQEVLDKFTPILNERSINYEVILDFEKPGEYICAVAKDKNADAIVLGTLGMGKIRRTILGSVSNYVLNHADCPVLVCRAPKE